MFDPEPYNYVFNKSTSLLDGQFVEEDHIQLENVLRNFNELNPIMLELLHYTQALISQSDDLIEQDNSIRIDHSVL